MRLLGFVVLMICACEPRPLGPDAGALLDAGQPGQDAGPSDGGRAVWVRVASPTNVDLSGVWGAAANDVWIVGGTGIGFPSSPDAGAILHWQGSQWSSIAGPATAFLTAVWGSAPSDVWAVGFECTVPSCSAGAGAILHWDGASWSKVSSPTSRGLYGVWGTGASDVWAASSGGMIHYDGVSWSVVPVPTPGAGYLGVWAGGSQQAWAVGAEINGGFVNAIEWTGAAWTQASVFDPPDGGGPATGYLNAVWGSSAADVWAVGSEGNGGEVILHWQGRSWDKLHPNISPWGALNGVWGAAANDVWAVGARASTPAASACSILHWQGSEWAPQDCPDAGTLRHIAAAGGTVWSVGNAGTILQLQRQ